MSVWSLLNNCRMRARGRQRIFRQIVEGAPELGELVLQTLIAGLVEAV